MAVYAIGDVQGCYAALQALLKKLGFDSSRDVLWFAGDLVNRGPQSLEILRFVRGLGDAAITVLGNHDLHLLALARGLRRPTRRDNVGAVLDAPDRDVLFDWIRTRPLMHTDDALGYTMIHAGLAPQWDIETAARCAREVEQVLRGEDYWAFIEQMYGDEPDRWSMAEQGMERWRFIVNCFTRLRYCDDQGRLVLGEKAAPGTQAQGVMPWFAVPDRRTADNRLVFGHWSTLGLYAGDNVFALDSGCVWGGALTAMRLDVDEPHFVSVACDAACDIGEV